LGNGKTTEVKHNAIATKACKSAIKGNDELQINEMVKFFKLSSISINSFLGLSLPKKYGTSFNAIDVPPNSSKINPASLNISLFSSK
ncbi:DNA mismatch repair protein MutL, partial [human gut metagenome]